MNKAAIGQKEQEETLRTIHEAYRDNLTDELPEYKYLISKGWDDDDIKDKEAGLGYCKRSRSLVIPILTGAYNSDLHGFIFRKVSQSYKGVEFETAHFEASVDTSKILLGDPLYKMDQKLDLLIVSDPLDHYRLRNHVAFFCLTQSTACIYGDKISDTHAKRLTELNPRSIVYIRGSDATAKGLQEALRKFCLTELILFSVVALRTNDVSEYIVSERLEEGSSDRLNEKIRAAISSAALLDRTARSGAQLLSWLATQRPALKTGYEKFDKSIRIPVAAITIVAGRPKHGKTTFLYNLMLQMIESGLYDRVAGDSDSRDKRFYFFSYEEGGYQIKQKIISRILEADSVNVRSLAIKHNLPDVRNGEDLIQQYSLKRDQERDFEIPELVSAGAKLNTLLSRISVVKERLTVEELDKMIRKLNKREAVGAIFIDYMQRIPIEKDRNTIRESMNHVSDTLKWCAVNTGLSLVVGAQIGRKADERGRPAQSDIKESGNLEEDANLLLCVYNVTQAEIDKGTKEAIKGASSEHTLEVYTLNSRDSEPSDSKFIMRNRHIVER